MDNLLVIGGIALDYLSKVKDMSAQFTTVIEYSENLGGMGYNTSMTASQLGLRTTLVSAVGQDFPGIKKNRNLSLNLTRTKDSTTRSFLFFDDKSERIYFYRGAYHDIDVMKANLEIKKSGWVHFAGIAPCFSELMKTAVSEGKNISFNPGYDLFHYKPSDPLVLTLLKSSDYIVLSSNELDYLGREASGLAKKATVVTMGKKGSFIYGKGQKVDIPAYTVEVKSPFGAGDTYTGTLIAGLMKGLAITKAAKLASAAGSFAVEEKSTTPNLSWAKIEKRAEIIGKD